MLLCSCPPPPATACCHAVVRRSCTAVYELHHSLMWSVSPTMLALSVKTLSNRGPASACCGTFTTAAQDCRNREQQSTAPAGALAQVPSGLLQDDILVPYYGLQKKRGSGRSELVSPTAWHHDAIDRCVLQSSTSQSRRSSVVYLDLAAVWRRMKIVLP